MPQQPQYSGQRICSFRGPHNLIPIHLLRTRAHCLDACLFCDPAGMQPSSSATRNFSVQSRGTWVPTAREVAVAWIVGFRALWGVWGCGAMFTPGDDHQAYFSAFGTIACVIMRGATHKMSPHLGTIRVIIYRNSSCSRTTFLYQDYSGIYYQRQQHSSCSSSYSYLNLLCCVRVQHNISSPSSPSSSLYFDFTITRTHGNYVRRIFY